MLMAGTEKMRRAAHCKLIRLDLRPHHHVIDPSVTPLRLPLSLNPSSLPPSSASGPAWPKFCRVTSFTQHVDSIALFDAPLGLCHLLCVAHDQWEIAIYDWLTGDILCTLPQEDDSLSFSDDDTQYLESHYYSPFVQHLAVAYVIPAKDKKNDEGSAFDLVHHGLRLIAVSCCEDEEDDDGYFDHSMENTHMYYNVWDLTCLLEGIHALSLPLTLDLELPSFAPALIIVNRVPTTSLRGYDIPGPLNENTYYLTNPYSIVHSAMIFLNQDYFWDALYLENGKYFVPDIDMESDLLYKVQINDIIHLDNNDVIISTRNDTILCAARLRPSSNSFVAFT
ncbi:hypothetical protein BC940DRAFT_307994 [Gongronella butleri]|nr:hypothetical protein BC940DRAFT_307994 [Gongronella butleri]